MTSDLSKNDIRDIIRDIPIAGVLKPQGLTASEEADHAAEAYWRRKGMDTQWAMAGDQVQVLLSQVSSRDWVRLLFNTCSASQWRMAVRPSPATSTLPSAIGPGVGQPWTL